MRITGSIEFKTEHGSHGVDIVATWDVPYVGWAKGEVIEEIEAGDRVLLTKLTLVVDGISRDLTLPVGPMLAGFLKAYEEVAADNRDELIELFCEDARDTYHFHLEQEFTRQRELARQ